MVKKIRHGSKIRQLVLIAIILLSTVQGYSQYKYIGLAKESNIRDAQDALAISSTDYWPKSKIIGDSMYVCTINGIYTKDLRTNDTNWSHYAFQGEPVRDFIKKGDSILCITAKTKDSLVLLSTNNGVSYQNYTSPFFFKNGTYNTVYSFAQNPQNQNSVIAVHNNVGIAKSHDFGYTWDTLKNQIAGYQEWFVGFHPLDTNSLYHTGEQMFFESFIQVSNNNGKDWMLTGNIHNHCTHVLAFHPTDTNILLSGGEGMVGKSYDRGRTWTYVDTLPRYIFSIIYDKRNSDIAYAVGDFHGINDTLKVYYSRDGGDSWSILHEQPVANSDGMIQVHQYKNKLVLQTLTSGILMYDIDTVVNINNVHTEPEISIYPNPASEQFTIICDAKITDARLTDITGKVKKLYAEYPRKNLIVNCSDVPDGLYILTLKLDRNKEVTRVIQIE